VRINVDGLHFSYSSKPVLRDLDLQINKGELVGIVGSNGSGKSTLIKCINKLLKPDKGSVFLNSEDIANLNYKEISRFIGYVPQSIPNDFSSTVFETVLMGRKPHMDFAPKEKDFRKTADLLSAFGIENISMECINELSGGQRQKVFIARSLAQEPRIMLLDEPTANLDMKHQLEAMELIKKVSKKGMCVIIAIHDINLAAKYCNKFIMLKEGRIHDIGSKEILHQENIKEVYGVDADIISNEKHFVILPKIASKKIESKKIASKKTNEAF
jgi:iron complex transport system ATP-binding protein